MSMKRILAGTAVAGMLFVNHACMNRNVNAMREEIDKLKRGTISLPLMQMKCIHQDLWHDASEKRPLKLVVYSDSSACSSCAVSQLYTWIDLMRESEPYQGKFGYHFIFCPKTNDKANVELAIMALQHFKHPVFIDTANVFERSNPHLPNNPPVPHLPSGRGQPRGAGRQPAGERKDRGAVLEDREGKVRRETLTLPSLAKADEAVSCGRAEKER